jgi:uncharacterized protein YbjQ (UPF0145 family)
MAYAGEAQVWVTTANNFEGYRITRYLGLVRGITVRSRGALGQIGAGFQQLVGGNITLYTEMCEHAREEAFQLLVQHAAEKGANAIVAMRYDATEVAQGATEVLAYGTAAIIEAATPEK